eukprot:CAMPEP_0202694984 /NCGR_PEP_ID=MMETSP1385-20130828/8698_1 /ASSEMBLY_ACC=CAM_ASM_000861 /TAXON_ID=933848 /ORGANISM="Elphidium margaritaceum" /LENGTH=769 /DNA_ID=CAMNT_0049350935 /DNA_START=36 /DNA_END=2345 /DNA_ORIENTATION=-
MGGCCSGSSKDPDTNVESAEIDAESKNNMQRKNQSPQKASESKDASINRITLYVIQAKNLPGYDIGGTSDPYCVVTFDVSESARYRTSTARRELNPVWNAMFVQEDRGLFSRNRQITIDVYDHDSLSADDFIGTARIDTNQQPSMHYATPIQYVSLLDKKGNAVMDDNGRASAIQIKLKYTLDTHEMNIRQYTHIMEATVKKVRPVHALQSNSYVTLEFGAQNYETKRLEPPHDDDNELIWDEVAYVFAHHELHQNFQLKVSVLSDELDNARDHIGTGYIAAADIFEQCSDESASSPYTTQIALREVPVSLDKGLVDFDDDEKSSAAAFGDLEIEFRLRAKKVVDKEFYSALVRTFDRDDDGTIDRNEVMQMFAQLEIPEDSDAFFQRFDENKDGEWDETEVVRMLQDTDFQSSELAPQLMSIYLRGGDLGTARGHLMSGFTGESAPTSKIPKVMDRRTGLLVQEHIPGYVWFAFKLLYGQGLGRTAVSSKATQTILSQMSSKRGRAMDDPSSKSQISEFVKQHNLDTKILYKKPEQFETFNDFFARPIQVDDCRPLDSPEDETVVVSAADCRFMCWESILDSTKFWVKGEQFTVENLCGSNSAIEIEKYMGGSFCIFRLAPQDYHRWHWPIGGTVKRIEHIDGALYSVNPIVVKGNISVYTENKRAVIEIENEACGGCLMFVIAATLVGSYKLFRTQGDAPSRKAAIELQEGDQIKRGDLSGEFRFGGSTILCLFESKKVNFDDDIVRNVNANVETLLRARTRIGKIQ